MGGSDMVVAWLNDAYGMEQALVKVLENHVKDAEGHPQVHAKIEQHLQQTRQHAELVKGCVERLGGDVSSFKSGLASMAGMLQGMSTAGAQDELVKDGIMDFAAENFEIASYKGIIAAAEFLGDHETVRIAKQILPQEEDMANFLAQQLPRAIKETLSKGSAKA